MTRVEWKGPAPGMSDPSSFVGRRIRKAREERKMTQKGLGLLMGYTPDTIANYERGRRRISLEDLFRVADILKKPVGWFLKEEDRPEGREIGHLLERTLIEFLPIRRVPVYASLREERVPEVKENIIVREEVEADYAVVAADDGMDPLISRGDLVMCRRLEGELPPHGSITVVSRLQDERGAAAFRYFLLEDGEHILRAANPAYPDLRPGNDAVVLGIVTLIEKRPTPHDESRVAERGTRYRVLPDEWLNLFRRAEELGVTAEALKKIMDALGEVKRGDEG